MTEYTKTCPYCKKSFTAKRSNKIYCTPSHRTMASRKGQNKHEYPNQLEIGLKRSIGEVVSDLLMFEEDGISIKDIIELKASIKTMWGLTMELVNPENIYYSCLVNVIEPLIMQQTMLPIIHQNGIMIYSDNSNKQFFDYKTLDQKVEFKISHEYYNRLKEIDDL